MHEYGALLMNSPVRHLRPPMARRQASSSRC